MLRLRKLCTLLRMRIRKILIMKMKDSRFECCTFQFRPNFVSFSDCVITARNSFRHGRFLTIMIKLLFLSGNATE